MAASANGGERYEVDCSGEIDRAIERLFARALVMSRGKEVLEAFEQVIRRLRHDPLHFGEPIYHLPALRMEIRTAVVLPLSVDFAVHEDRPLVWIKGVKLL